MFLRAGLLSLAVFSVAWFGTLTSFAAASPGITTQPQSQSVLLGSNALFTVVAGGQTPLSYQWSFNGTDLTNSAHVIGATNTTLTVSNLLASDAGGYQVLVSNSHGSATSSIAVLTVLIPAGITAQPQGQTIYLGDPAVFSVTAAGTAPLSYQWAFNGSNLPGRTGTVFSIAAATTNQTGNYSVTVTNLYGSVTSSNALLTVLDGPPVIVSQPADQTVFLGNTLTLPVGAAGSKPLSYQWQFNGNNLAGVTNATLTLSGMTPQQAGEYSVLVSNRLGVTASSNALVQVPEVTSWGYSSATNVPAGLTNVMLMSAGWFNNWALQADGYSTWWGNSGWALAIPPGQTNLVQVGLGANYSLGLWPDGQVSYWGCVGCNGENDLPPDLTNIVSIAAGEFHEVALHADGTVDVWGFNAYGTTDLPAGLSNVAAIFAGSYQSYALKTDGTIVAWGRNDYGQCDVPAGLSNVVSVTGGLLGGAAAKSDGTVVAWGYYPGFVPAGLSNVVALSAGELDFVALKQDGTVVAWGSDQYGQTDVPPGLTNVLEISSGVSHNTVLIGPPFAQIKRQPVDASVLEGGDTFFYAPTTGRPPLSYQWQFNGANIPGATRQSVWLNDVQPTDAGNYALVVANAFGAVTSRVAVLTVDVPPTITGQPQSQTVLVSNGVSFAVSAAGTAPLSCQWYFNGAPLSDNGRISGSTTTNLLISNAQTSDAGSYTVIVSNPFGSVTSTGATLTVWEPPQILAQPQPQLLTTGMVVNLSVNATGTAPLSYQWIFNGTALTDSSRITGSTTATLSISNAQLGDSGNYWVLITNVGGAAVSSIAAVNVLVPPAITSQPTSQTLVQGSTATFNAAAAGSAPLSYRWFFNGAPLTDGGQFSGSGTPSMSISNVQSTNAGSYALVVTNPVGTATSAAAVLTVLAPPTIVQQPAYLSAQLSARTMFSVTATGTAPLSYQWSFNGLNLFGATNSTLALTNLQVSQAGNYAVTITNAVGSIVSSNAMLTVTLPPPGVPFISSFSSASAYPGVTLTILGTNFSPIAGSNLVYFGAAQTAVLSASVTNLSVNVPVGATFGPLTVTVGGLVASSDALFEPTFPGTNSPISTSTFAPGFNLGTSVNPSYAVIADLDGDGKPDIALVAGGGHVVSIFQNISRPGVPLSAASFAPRIDLPFPGTGVADNPYRLRAVDLDGDGRLDLIAAEAGGNRVSIFHNISRPGTLSTSSFEPSFALITGTDCRFVVATDLDDDGHPDIVALNYGDKTISIFQNIGVPGTLTTNSFALALVLPAPGGPYEAVLADLDGDGKPDLAVANQDNNTVSIYQNLSTAGVITSNSFAARVDLPGDSGPDTIAAVDLDGDGRLDLVVGAVRSETIYVLRNLSSGGLLTSNSFAPLVDFGTGNWTHTVAVADINGDAKPDIAVVGELPSIMSIFQNASTPGDFNVSSFLPRVDFSTGWNAWGVAVGDLDGDGRPEVIFCNDYDNTLSIYQNQAPFSGPPVIVAQPAGITVPLGNSAQFSGVAMGQSPLSFQWYFNGTNLTDNGHITGSAAGTLSISNALGSDTGSYYFIVTNSVGAATSTVAKLTVLVPPIFTQQPSNQVVVPGSNATFTVVVSGTAPFTYQWWFNSAPLTDNGHISGSATANLTIANAQQADTGTYQVIVSGPGGSAGSATATLIMATPFITSQPQNQSVFGGATVTFNVGATGQQPLSYQWLFDGTNLPSAITNPLVLTNVQVSEAGFYSVIITNVYGIAISSNATLRVAPLAITTQPTNRVAWPGGTATFRVNVSGQGPFSFDWQCNGVDVPIPATNVLTLTNLQMSQFGTYDVIISNAYGSITSSNVSLSLSQVAVWGGAYGETNLTSGLTNIVAISGGAMEQFRYDCVALRSNGTLLTWPLNLSGPQTNGVTNLIAIAGGGVPYALRANGSVVQISYNGATLVPALTNIAALSSFNTAVIGLQTNGKVVSPNLAGPPLPAAASNMVAIAQGAGHALALRPDGTIFAWGSNIYGQTNVPPGLSNVVAIAAGYYHSLALTGDGTVVAWGQNGSGQTNVPSGLHNVVAIAAGSFHSLALKADGTVAAWGLNTTGQTNVPPTLTNVVAIAGGDTFSMALLGTGPPVTQGLLSNPTLASGTFSVSLPSQSGKVYGLEYKNTPSDTNWTLQPLVPGNGSIIHLFDPAATNGQRFYRVQRW